MNISIRCAFLLNYYGDFNLLVYRAVLWLETYLQTKWKNTLFVISHDREFINSVTTDIYYLHQQTLTHYSGNYDQFEETRNEQLRNQRSAHEAQVRFSSYLHFISLIPLFSNCNFFIQLSLFFFFLTF